LTGVLLTFILSSSILIGAELTALFPITIVETTTEDLGTG
jgi:hypothetical protein